MCLCGKESACQCGRRRRFRFDSLDQKDPLEEKTATHSSIFAWKIPWAEEPGELQFFGLQRVGCWMQVNRSTRVSVQYYIKLQ